jgi:beta propeller repeat protein
MIKKFVMYLLLAGFFVLPAAHFVQANVSGKKDKPDIKFVETEIIVKFNAHTAGVIRSKCLGKSQKLQLSKQRSDRVIISTDLDKILKRHQAKQIAPVFKNLTNTLKQRNISSSSYFNALKKKFPKRSARAEKNGTRPELENIFIIQLENKRSAMDLLAALKNNQAVLYAERNGINEIQWIPNDPYFHSANSWGQGYDDLWALKQDKLNCQSAWDISRGEGVIVAVVDTGVDYTHEDFKNSDETDNIWRNQAELNGIAGFDDDGNGYTDDVMGFNFCVDSPDPMDDNLHGTHVSGIIAAAGNNNKGIIGIAPLTKIMALKSLSCLGLGSNSTLVEALYYAADNGADVINCSWGQFGYSQLMADAINYVSQQGCVVVAAAGNYNYDAAYFSPPGLENVITVASTDHLDQKSIFSNYGKVIDVAAPGGDSHVEEDNKSFINILSLLTANPYNIDGMSYLIVGEKYLRLLGTSMAAPHAAGVAALVISHRPDFSILDTTWAIKASADDIGVPGNDDIHGEGRINAHKALSQDRQVIIRCQSYSINDIETGNNNGMLDPNDGSAKLVFVLKNCWLPAQGISATLSSNDPYIAITQNHADFGSAQSGETVNNQANPFSVSISPAMPFEHLIQLSLTISDDQGYSTIYYFKEKVKTISSKPNWPVTLNPLPDYMLEIGTPKVADLNGDGKQEVLCHLYYAELYKYFLYALDCNGTILPGQWPIEISGISCNHSINSPLLADINQDNQLEILFSIVDENKNFSIYAFNQQGQALAGNWPFVRNIPELSIASAQFADFVKDKSPGTVGDVDNDGSLEFIGGVGSHLFVIRQDGTLLFEKNFTNCGSAEIITCPVISDIDNDGLNEIVMALDKLYVFTGNGSDKPGWPCDSFGETRFYKSPLIADIDRDGDLEIICPFVNTQSFLGYSYGVAVFNHDGSLFPGWPIQPVGMNQAVNGQAGDISIADLDQDGDLEIIIQVLPNQLNYSGLNVYHHDTTCMNGFPQSFPWCFDNCQVAVGDVDGDHHFDILCTGLDVFDPLNGWLTYYGFKADGSQLLGFPHQVGLSGQSPIIADLENDGKNDMVIAYSITSGVIDVLNYNQSQGTGHETEWPMFQHDPMNSGIYQHEGSFPIVQATCHPAAGKSPLLVHFDASGSSDPHNLPLTYLWEFPDGTISSAAITDHEFIAGGATEFLQVLLTVKNSLNKTRTKPFTIQVSPFDIPHIDDVNVNSHSIFEKKTCIGFACSTIELVTIAADPNQEPLTYLVENLPIASQWNGNTLIITSTLNDANIYHPRIVVTNPSGARDEFSFTLIILTDTSLPTGAIINPVNNSTIAANDLIASGTAKTASGIRAISFTLIYEPSSLSHYLIDEQPAQYDERFGTWHYPISSGYLSQPGQYRIKADLLGNNNFGTEIIGDFYVNQDGTFSLTSADAMVLRFDIGNSKLVWEDHRAGNSDIYVKDLASGIVTQITNDIFDQMLPAISGNRIVYQDDRQGNEDIYMYDLSTGQETQITNHPARQVQPQIDGNHIIWVDDRFGSGRARDIFLYDLTTQQELRVTDVSAKLDSPDMQGNCIVWHALQGADTEIFLYKIDTGQIMQITNDDYSQSFPKVYGQRIVWEDSRSLFSDIYCYDLTSGQEQLVYSSLNHKTSLSIWKSEVVWQESMASRNDIYLYNFSDQHCQRITSASSEQSHPIIFADILAWLDPSAHGIFTRNLKKQPAIIANWHDWGIFARDAETQIWECISEDPVIQTAAGDFDGDNTDDLLIWRSDELSIRFGSDGHMESIAVSHDINYITTGDIDGDGSEEILGSWTSGVWMLNWNKGQWIQLHNIPAHLLATGDIDGDGLDDLVGHWHSVSGIWIRYSNNGTWERVEASDELSMLACGDINGNGKDNILASGNQNAEGVWLRDSQSPYNWSKIHDYHADLLALCDLDLDGNADIYGVWDTAGFPGIWGNLSKSGQWLPIFHLSPDWITAGNIK